MKKDTFKTAVLFFTNINGPYGIGQPEALFINEKDKDNFYGSYAHIGQHNKASIRYFKENCKISQLGEFEDLAKELNNIGYNLDILNCGLNETFDGTKKDIDLIKQICYLIYNIDIYEMYTVIEDYADPYLFIETELDDAFSLNLTEYLSLSVLDIINLFVKFYKDNY